MFRLARKLINKNKGTRVNTDTRIKAVGEMAEQVSALFTKPEDWSSGP